MDDKNSLSEVEDLLRNSPPQSAFTERENDEVLDWLGRTAAVLTKWNSVTLPPKTSPVCMLGFSGSLEWTSKGPESSLEGGTTRGAGHGGER